MKEKIAIYLTGLGGVASIGMSIYGINEVSGQYRVKGDDIFFIALSLVFGIAAVYTANISIIFLKNSDKSVNGKSLLALKAEKTRLQLEKEIHELKQEQQKT